MSKMIFVKIGSLLGLYMTLFSCFMYNDYAVLTAATCLAFCKMKHNK